MALGINLGLQAGVTSVAGTEGQILCNGQFLPVQGGAVTISLAGGLTGATGFYAVLTGMSGALEQQINAAAGVLALNSATGLLTLTSAPANANYVKVTTSGTTIMVSGDSTPQLSGVILAGGARISGNGAGDLYLMPSGATKLFLGGATPRINFLGGGGTIEGTLTVTNSLTTQNAIANTDGSAAAPSYTFSNGNGERGMYSFAPFHLGFSTSGLAALVLTSTQNVMGLSGIFYRDTGNYTRSGAASVAQLYGLSGAVFNGGAAGTVVYTTGNQTITGVKSFNTDVSITGWGVSTPLTIEARGAQDSNNAGLLVYTNVAQTAARGLAFIYSDNAATTADALRVQQDGTSSNIVRLIGSDGNSKMVVTSAGNVGIGTGSPSDLLEVSQNQNAATRIRITNASVDGGAGTAATTELRFVGAGNSFLGGLNAYGDEYADATLAGKVVLTSSTTLGSGMSLRVNGNNAVNITNAGNVGIGTATAQQLLHVSGGNLRVDGDALINGATTATLKFTPGSSSNAVIMRETNTFFTFGPNGELTVASNGTAQPIRILPVAGGTVGVGNTTFVPQQLLHVSGGNLRVDGSGIFGFPASQVLIGTTGATGFGALQLAVHSTSGGGVGMGPDLMWYRSANSRVTLETNAAQAPTLVLKGTDRSANITIGSDAAGIAVSRIQPQRDSAAGTNAGVKFWNGNAAINYGTQGYDTTSSFVLQGMNVLGAQTEFLRITSGAGNLIMSGYLGIGTSEPFYPLTVQSNGFASVAALTSATNTMTLQARRDGGVDRMFLSQMGDYPVIVSANSFSSSSKGALFELLGLGYTASANKESVRIYISDPLALFGTRDAVIDTNAAGTGVFRSIQIKPGGTLAATFATGGNVGIGSNTNPVYLLDVSGTAAARNYVAQVSGAAIPLNASATGTYNIDFTNSAALQTLTITGAVLFSGVNYVAGSAATVRVNVSGSNAVPVRFPDSWNWVSSTPTGLVTNRFAVLTLQAFTANDTGVCVGWTVAP